MSRKAAKLETRGRRRWRRRITRWRRAFFCRRWLKTMILPSATVAVELREALVELLSV